MLSPRVFLAFDDFSHAGKYALRFTKFAGAEAFPLPQTFVEGLLPRELCPFVHIFQYPENQAAIILVDTAKLQATQRWEMADALVAAISKTDVQTLTILAALHLPYAKEGDLNVFYGSLNTEAAEDASVDVAALRAVDPAWVVKDPWLAALLHLIKVEQWPRTHLLLAKGYKPGRDLTATYEAVNDLSRALEFFTKEQFAVDAQQVQRELPRVLAKEKIVTTDERLTLLYH